MIQIGIALHLPRVGSRISRHQNASWVVVTLVLDIPAKIGKRQPARLADGEFVVPADVVSGIGNGSTDAGARKLYAMMDKVRSARTGTKKQGREIKAEQYLPT
jgi:hypothetical protein